MLTVLAAEGGNPVSVQLMPLLTAIVVFVIAFLVLKVAVWPKITKGLDDRDRKIRDEIRSAEEAREQAKAALAEYQRNLASAREEATRMIAQARTDAKAAAEELRSRNEAELADLKARATREIEESAFAQTTTGRSIARLRAAGMNVVVKAALNNKTALAKLYNDAIRRELRDHIALFVHDDVWIDDGFIAQHLHEGLLRYDVIGVAGCGICRPKIPGLWNRNRGAKERRRAFQDSGRQYQQRCNFKCCMGGRS